jgi:hypothetical protein
MNTPPHRDKARNVPPGRVQLIHYVDLHHPVTGPGQSGGRRSAGVPDDAIQPSIDRAKDEPKRFNR